MNLLITGAWQGAKENIKKIENLGHKISFLQFEKDELPCAYEWVEGVICNGLFLHHAIEKFTNLKYIQLTSAGFDRVNMKYIKANNIAIYNARDVYSIPMAEFAIAGVLEIYKQLIYFHENQKEYKWEKHRGLLELYEKNICIVGCGRVGTECAKRFQAFGCHVIGIDLFPREDMNYEKMIHLNNLEDILPNTDILILTVPLTNETKHMINEKKLNLLKTKAILINISRGAVIDDTALIEALNQNLGGVVLDVFENEPLDKDSPLWNMKNVIITPHNSFVGENNQKRLAKVIIGNLERE